MSEFRISLKVEVGARGPHFLDNRAFRQSFEVTARQSAYKDRFVGAAEWAAGPAPCDLLPDVAVAVGPAEVLAIGVPQTLGENHRCLWARPRELRPVDMRHRVPLRRRYARCLQAEEQYRAVFRSAENGLPHTRHLRSFTVTKIVSHSVTFVKPDLGRTA